MQEASDLAIIVEEARETRNRQIKKEVSKAALALGPGTFLTLLGFSWVFSLPLRTQADVETAQLLLVLSSIPLVIAMVTFWYFFKPPSLRLRVVLALISVLTAAKSTVAVPSQIVREKRSRPLINECRIALQSLPSRLQWNIDFLLARHRDLSDNIRQALKRMIHLSKKGEFTPLPKSTESLESLIRILSSSKNEVTPQLMAASENWLLDLGGQPPSALRTITAFFADVSLKTIGMSLIMAVVVFLLLVVFLLPFAIVLGASISSLFIPSGAITAAIVGLMQSGKLRQQV